MFAWLLLTLLPKFEPFLTALENFVIAHWKGISICLMIGMLAYQNFSTTRYVLWIETIPHLEQQVSKDESQIKQLKSDLDIAAKANANLTTTIQNQNATVQQWKDISDKLQKQNVALATRITQMQQDEGQQVTNILNGPTPTTCEASIQYLRDMRTKLGW